MSLDAIAALLGHKTLAMTMIYARIADKTVADEYFAVTEKVEALYDQPRRLPGDDEGAEMRKLRGEMHRRMLGNGYCARPVEMEGLRDEAWGRVSSGLVPQGPPTRSRASRFCDLTELQNRRPLT